MELGDTGWLVWRQAVLRTTGFPAAGLDRLAAPGAAAAADAYLDGQLDAGAFAAAYDEAASACARELVAIAAEPLFREAVAWQNPGALTALDGLVRSGPAAGPADNRRARYRRRSREELVARYWQRYCAKNETVGFFGPTCWTTLDPAGTGIVVRPGPGLVRERRVAFEQWPMAALAERLAAEPDVRPWLPVALHPQLLLGDRQVLRPAQPPAPLSPAEAAVLALCDGQRPAAEVAALALAGPAAGLLRREADVYLTLERLVERGLVHWGVDVPFHHAESRLRAVLERIAAPDVRRTAMEGLDRLAAARDRVSSACDPDGLAAALAGLDAEFTAVTGREPRRRGGQAYAGRTLCYLEASRDLEVVIGGAVLDALARPLAVLLRAARWLTTEIAGAYEGALQAIYADLADELGTTDVPFDQVWFLAQGLLFGTGERPADAVAAELARRWSELFGLECRGPDVRRLDLASSDLEAAAAAAFPADRPGYRAGWLHSPDVHVCASSPEALNAGDFTIVLGEMHAGWATFDAAVFELFHEAPDELRAALAADVGTGRVLPVLPVDWPRYTTRIARCLDNDTDWQLGFLPAPVDRRERLLPVTALTASIADGRLVARTADGRCWPAIEVFSEFISIHTADAFKLVTAAPHTPRITIDRLVLARETWRTTVAATGLADAAGPREQYLAARRWRRKLDLPERVFVRVATETKPVYLDLGSPSYVSSCCALLRSAGPDAGLVVSEMLPTPDQAWVTDAEGRTYLSELRLQVRDPAPTEGAL